MDVHSLHPALLLPAAQLAPRIQHTLIERGLTDITVEHHCRQALEHRFDAVMVAPRWVALAGRLTAGSGVKVASAVDFPLGLMTTAGRVAEVEELRGAGVDELDVGVAVGWLREGRDGLLRDDLAAVVAAAGPVPVKLMLELPLLTADERERAVAIAVDVGAAWVKNASNGDFGPALPEDVAFLRERVPPDVGVKASGGIRTEQHVRDLLAAGADLIGTSAGVAIVTGAADGAGGAY